MLSDFSWSCAFTYVDLVIAAAYTIYSLVSLQQLVKLIRQNADGLRFHNGKEKTVQKLFLSTVFILCVLRSANFYLEPLFWVACRRDVIQGGPHWWLDTLGTFPAALYFTAFTILIYKFASIYHNILKYGYRNHRYLFHLLRAILLISNSAVYLVLILSYVLVNNHIIGTIAIYCLSIISFLLGLAFAVYGGSIFYMFWKIRLLETGNRDSLISNQSDTSVLGPDQPSQTSTTHIQIPVSPSHSHSSHSSHSSGGHASTHPTQPASPHSVHSVYGHHSVNGSYGSYQGSGPLAAPIAIAKPQPLFQPYAYDSHVSQSGSPTNSPRLSSSASMSNLAAAQETSSLNSASKPMHKLAVVTIFCNLCFTARALILLFGDMDESPWAFGLYFFFAEILPLGLMILVFAR